MSRVPPMASPAPPPSDADKDRIVSRYQGAQIIDGRDHIRVVLTGTPPRGVRASLRMEGFSSTGREGEYQRRHSPIAAITAAAICNTFFDKEC